MSPLVQAISRGYVTVRIQVYENYKGPNGTGREMFIQEMRENGSPHACCWKFVMNKTPKKKNNLLGPWEASLYFHKPKDEASISLLKLAKKEAGDLAPKSRMRSESPWGAGIITSQDLFIMTLKMGLRPVEHVVANLPHWIMKQYAA